MSAVDTKHIIERIRKDAEAEAAELIDAANQVAAEKLEAAKEQVELNRLMKMEKAHANLVREQEQYDQIRRNELKKAVLENKQKILAEVFDSAHAALEKMSATDAKKLADELVKKHSSPGDTVKQVKGGVVISNDKYEIRLTHTELLALLREDIECSVAKMLFGASKEGEDV